MAPEIDGKLFLNDIETESGDTARPGDIVEVEITQSHEYDLAGRVTQILDTRAEKFPALPMEFPARRIGTGAALRVLA